MERQLKAWLAVSEENRLAFERCTEVWMEVPNVPGARALLSPPPVRPKRRRLWHPALLALPVVAVALAIGGYTLWPTGDLYATSIGEYRKVVLADGTQLRLNTDTRLRVTLNRDSRVVEFESGEALFEVAKDPSRPFIVRVGANQVRALGTVFTVRSIPSSPEPLSVTLVEGKVEVGPTTTKKDQPNATPLVLQPGQRVKLSKASDTPVVDRPPAEQTAGWLRQEVSLTDMTLAEAIAEMNRYTPRPIALDNDPRLSRMRVSGIYRIGDSAGFATALAALHGLEVVDQSDRVLIVMPRGSAAAHSGEAAPVSASPASATN